MPVSGGCSATTVKQLCWKIKAHNYEFLRAGVQKGALKLLK